MVTCYNCVTKRALEDILLHTRLDWNGSEFISNPNKKNEDGHMANTNIESITQHTIVTHFKTHLTQLKVSWKKHLFAPTLST